MKKLKILVVSFLLAVFGVNNLSAQIFKTNPELKNSYHEFDFWLGEWDVYIKGSDKLAGKSHIMTINDSTAILENYSTPDHSYKGKSLNTFNPKTKNWEQYWTDNSGLVLVLTGGIIDGKMVLKSSGDSVINRISWEALNDGTVNQVWDFSGDDGKTWTVAFDGIYSRVKGK